VEWRSGKAWRKKVKEGSFSQFLWAFEEAVANASVLTYYAEV
jgi:hypothetical protein